MHDAVAARFSNAAERYDRAADVQRRAARHFDAWLAQRDLPDPDHIAEIGCGTGMLTRLLHARFPQAEMCASDLAPVMVATCRAGMPASTRLRYAVCDGRTARFDPAPDWIVSAMCFQWFDPLLPVLSHHMAQARVLAFSIVLDGSFAEWTAAHARHGLTPGLRRFPQYEALRHDCESLGNVRVVARRLSLHESCADGLSFARSLRAIGADAPRAGHTPVNLRRVLRELEHGVDANYELGFFCIVRR